MGRIVINGRKRWGTAFVTTLAVLCAALLMVSLVMVGRVAALTRQINAGYQKALYESVALLQGVQLNLEKLMASGDNSQRQQILISIARQCEGAQADLAGIPLNPSLLGGTLKFVNQTGDYARVLTQQLADRKALSDADSAQLSSLHDACVTLNQQMSQLVSDYESGKLVFEPNPKGSAAGGAAQDLAAQNQPSVDYPVLLYDGPFSDARDGSSAPAQPLGQPVSAQQAQQRLTEFIGAERVKSARYTGESQILGKCFQFEVETADSGTLSADVTEAGGQVLDMVPERSVDASQAKLSVSECESRALEFAKSRGFGDMTVSYWKQTDGIFTVNLAPTQDGAILYPDLVKLQLSMKDGQVIGVEARSYLMNHRPRALVTPFFTQAQATAALSPALTLEQIRACVIPTDGGGEAQCWECAAAMSDGTTYLVYSDVTTGQERAILKVTDEANGIVTQ